jgi:IS30 family transposase
MKRRSKIPGGERPQRSARKLDRKAALDQQARGLSTREIAQLQGVAASTVRRFMDRMKPEQAAVEEFKNGRADVLARIQGKSLELQERILESIDDRLLNALTPHQKSGLLLSTNTVFGTTYDKERLERGKSTQNVGVVARIMGEALEKVYAQSGDEGDHEPGRS